MNCQECGFAMVKNGKRKLKNRGIVQNFCAGVVGKLSRMTGKKQVSKVWFIEKCKEVRRPPDVGILRRRRIFVIRLLEATMSAVAERSG